MSDINIKTIAIVLGITHLIQFIVIYREYKINKIYNGIGWWLMWVGAEIAGFTIITLRSYIPLNPLIIIFQNSFIVSGTLFAYIGIMKFLGKKVNWRMISIIFSTFLILLLYFIFISDKIVIRTSIISITLGMTAFYTAYNLHIHKLKSISSSANFTIITLLIHGIVFVYHSVVILLSPNEYQIYGSNFLNIIQYTDALAIGLLWTFGFIMMINQRLNSELSESKNHFEQIFNTSPDAAIITRLEDGKILDFNSSYTKITGYSREDLSDKSTFGINLWKDINDRKEVVRRVMEEGYCENYEAKFIRKDGKEITGLISANVIEFQGEKHIISISRDITERKRIEQRINIQNEELKTINTEKDKFFSIIAHDLRSPFNVFLGYTEIMSKDLQKLNMIELQELANNLHRTAHNLYRLLTNLLEWSKMQRGATTFNPVKLNLTEIIRDSILLFKETAIEKNIELKFEIVDNLLLTADKSMFETIIRNLISNALKFTRKQGRVFVSAKAEGNQICISVEDTGIGMDKDLVEDLFKMDKQTTRKGTEKEPSTGLGLLLCKEFIEKHSGGITVESKEGRGSIFTISLPIGS